MTNTKIATADLDKYIYYNALMEHTDGKLLVGVNSAIINTKWYIIKIYLVKNNFLILDFFFIDLYFWLISLIDSHQSLDFLFSSNLLCTIFADKVLRFLGWFYRFYLLTL